MKEKKATFNVEGARFVQFVTDLGDYSKSRIQVLDKDPRTHADAKVVEVRQPIECTVCSPLPTGPSIPGEGSGPGKCQPNMPCYLIRDFS